MTISVIFPENFFSFREKYFLIIIVIRRDDRKRWSNKNQKIQFKELKFTYLPFYLVVYMFSKKLLKLTGIHEFIHELRGYPYNYNDYYLILVT